MKRPEHIPSWLWDFEPFKVELADKKGMRWGSLGFLALLAFIVWINLW